MRSFLRPISALLAGVALLLLGNGLLNTVLTLLGAELGFSPVLIGLVMTGYFLGFFVGIWVVVPLVRRIGHIRAFAFCAALAASIALLHILIPSPWVWLVLRVLYGVALVSLYTVIESWLNASSPAERRGQIFATYMAVNLGALALAQQLIRLDDPAAFTLFAISAILISLALMPVTLTRLAQPDTLSAPRVRLGQLWKAAPLGMAAAGLSGLTMGAFWGLAPVYASRLGFDTAGIGLFMSATILGGALFQLPIGRYSDRHDRRRVLAWVATIATAVSAIMLLLPAGPPLVGVTLLWGSLPFALYPIAGAHTIDPLTPAAILAGSSGLLLVHGGGAALGPTLAGAWMSAQGISALPLYYALTL
ncbi:MAG: MFS transporter, partial [Ectothiorhodospiraceae bacterium]|nr:MFS transporter [Ectothiorhodospiraceae bacterium]